MRENLTGACQESKPKSTPAEGAGVEEVEA